MQLWLTQKKKSGNQISVLTFDEMMRMRRVLLDEDEEVEVIMTDEGLNTNKNHL